MPGAEPETRAWEQIFAAVTTAGDLLIFDANSTLSSSLPLVQPNTQIHLESFSGGYRTDAKEWILELYGSNNTAEDDTKDPLLLKLPSYPTFILWTRALESINLNSSKSSRYSRPPSPNTSFIAPSATEFSPPSVPSTTALRGRPYSQNDLILRRRKSAAGSFHSHRSDLAWNSFDYGRRDENESIPPVPTNPVVMNQLKTATQRKSSWISFKWLKKSS
ncbi:hypothetical protein HK100_000727 [Physocladia obscura]|uniref:Uncharacterized protein n=1 Tax=Physocladia obscura TaxID=109957 RepID=A0AAD5XCC8_9FUNG|nr:hypothetical protein HK100_000727 [Physocladia obscura]